MSAKFFVLYGDKTVTAHVTDDSELFEWVRRDGVEFTPANHPTHSQAIAAADKILLARYKAWGLFEYTPEGMAEFLEAAARQPDELVSLHALEIAEDFIQDAQRALAVALTKAQQKAMDRVKFPMAGNKHAFHKYQEKIAEIRDLSIKALYEYVENGDETPE